MTDLNASQVQDSTLGTQSSKFKKSSYVKERQGYPIPDNGTYVIRIATSGYSLDTLDDGRYLSWRRGEKFACMTDLADATVWTIKKDTNPDNEYWQYTISADGLSLGVVAPSAEDRDHRLPGEPENGPSHTTWILVQTMNNFIIHGVRQFEGLVIDLTSEDRVILWETNSRPNQSWAIYPYLFNTPRIETGTYRILLGTGSAAKYLALQSGTDVILKDLDINDASQRWKIEVTVYQFTITNEDGHVILSTAKTPSGGWIPHGGLGDEKEPKWDIMGVGDTGTYTFLDAKPYGNAPILLDAVNNKVVLSWRTWKDDTVWQFEKR